MSAELAHRIEQARERRLERVRTGVRARVVASIGPLTVLAGIVWAVIQPWRLTLLHPHGQGFWWLVSEPPLFVAAAGIAFRLVVAPALLRDLAQAEAEEDG